MATDTIQIHETIVSKVDGNGNPSEEVSRSEVRYSCVDPLCNLGFGDWEAVQEHCAVYHRSPGDEVAAQPEAEQGAVEAAPQPEQPAVTG